ncbi:MAG TPA: penicillin-binding protein 1A [Bauldia sp.]|nr:penicillin-binding protein 1A [Bauldia sp.]
MARKKPSGERVEPRADSAKGKGGDGFLGFGLREADRPGGGPRPKAARLRRRFFGGGARRKKRQARGDGPKRGLFSRILRRTAYWSLVVGIIGFTGLTAVVGYYWAKLPPTSEWTLPARPVNVRIVASDGTLITNRGDTAGATLSLDEMPPYLPEAVIAIEDRRFYYHFGIDPIGLVRAAIANFRAGGVVQGGSTLTQQLAKNLFLTPDRSFERKIQEAILAVWLEASLTKKQILELYLNRVYLGAGAYGVDAAARRYFGKSARNVTLAEAATIAGLLKAPTHYSPILDPEAAESRAQVVLAAMREQGYISDREASLAMSLPIKPVRDVAGGSGRYVADWVMDQLPSFVGAFDEDIVVDTTIDLKLQGLAQQALASTLNDEGGKYGVSEGAFVAMDPTGAVKALVGGRDYNLSPFNRAINGYRQPGSAFKPFVYLTALEHGLMPETVRIDQPVTIKGWSPENFSRKYLGPVTLQTALALSLNTVSAQLTEEVGPAAVAATAHRLGINSPLTATPSIALGTSEVNLLELTGAFAPFANGGTGVIPHVVKRITTAGGKVLYERNGDGPGVVVDPVYVGMMNSMLRQTLDTGTGKSAAIAGWPAAGKTGTSQDFRDAWFVGYTADLVAGVWFGNDNGTPTRKASGSNLPAMAWHRFMAPALDGLAVADLPGNYRFRDPGNVPGPAVASADPIGNVVSLSDDPDWQFSDQQTAAGPVPPAEVGETPGTPPKRKGFFRRLFGG